MTHSPETFSQVTCAQELAGSEALFETTYNSVRHAFQESQAGSMLLLEFAGHTDPLLSATRHIVQEHCKNRSVDPRQLLDDEATTIARVILQLAETREKA